MRYLVIYRTATHIAYVLHKSERAARRDEHMNDRWCGRLYSIADPDGFSGAEAKEIYHHGIEAMAPGWGLASLD